MNDPVPEDVISVIISFLRDPPTLYNIALLSKSISDIVHSHFQLYPLWSVSHDWNFCLSPQKDRESIYVDAKCWSDNSKFRKSLNARIDDGGYSRDIELRNKDNYEKGGAVFARCGLECTVSDEGISGAGIGGLSHTYLDTFELGGTLSIETSVKLTSFEKYSTVFEFSNHDGTDKISLYNEPNNQTIYWDIFSNASGKIFYGNNYELNKFTNIVLTITGKTMKVYKDGVLIGMNVDSHEPRKMKRDFYTLGAGLNGTIKFFRIWERCLCDREVKSLYDNK